jgi:hypothetical protein
MQLADALRRLSKASAAQARTATGHEANFLATERDLSMREAAASERLARTFLRQARRAHQLSVVLQRTAVAPRP